MSLFFVSDLLFSMLFDQLLLLMFAVFFTDWERLLVPTVPDVLNKKRLIVQKVRKQKECPQRMFFLVFPIFLYFFFS